MKFSDLAEGERTVQVDVSDIIDDDMRMVERVFKDNNFDLRVVGGAVRDLFTGEAPKDFDFATDATPDEMKTICDKAGLKWFPTGEEHGTLTILGPKTKEPYEITTLRIDSEHTGRHAEVEYTRSWQIDSERRDLTYNAMSMEFDGTVYDYHGGIEDLKNGVSRFVGHAESRIQEDYLRILRLFRFCCRYNSELSDYEKQAVKANVNGLKQISGERIWMEISKILAGKNNGMAIEEMEETGVARVIGLPTRDKDIAMQVKKLTNNPITVIMGLTNTQEELDYFITNWKWSNPEKKLAQFLLDHKFETLTEKVGQHMLTNGVPRDFVIELACLKLDASVANSIENWDTPVFPVAGRDLIALGMQAGPEMGNALKAMKLHWQQNDFQPSKKELLKSIG